MFGIIVHFNFRFISIIRDSNTVDIGDFENILMIERSRIIDKSY